MVNGAKPPKECLTAVSEFPFNPNPPKEGVGLAS